MGFRNELAVVNFESNSTLSAQSNSQMTVSRDGQIIVSSSLKLLNAIECAILIVKEFEFASIM